MANPRNKVSFNQIYPDRTTFVADGVTILYDVTQAGGSAQVGKAVMMAAGGVNGVVALTADGAFVVGVLEKVEPDLKCTILTGDYIQVPAAAAMANGQRIVGALSGGNRGYVRAAVAATLADVANQRGVVVEVTDTLNPWVFTD
jgi:hypothetical protein